MRSEFEQREKQGENEKIALHSHVSFIVTKYRTYQMPLCSIASNFHFYKIKCRKLSRNSNNLKNAFITMNKKNNTKYSDIGLCGTNVFFDFSFLFIFCQPKLHQIYHSLVNLSCFHGFSFHFLCVSCAIVLLPYAFVHLLACCLT